MGDQSFALNMVAVFRETVDGHLLDCNAACAQMLGYGSREELLATGRLNHVNESDALSVAAVLPDLGTLTNIELALRRKDGTVVWALQNLKFVNADEASKMWIEGAMFDVTEQREAAQRFEHQAYHDSVTAVPNRMLTLDRLTVGLARTRRRKRPLAVLVIDLDHFEMVNLTYGHGVGDRVLRTVGERLTECVRQEDAVGRYGSDEFLIVLAEMASETDAALAAQRVLDSVARHMAIDTHTIDVKASIGIAVSPQDGQTPETLIGSATEAMFQAKERGRNTFRFHVPELNTRAIERASLIASLRRAVARNEFELHYHPEVNVQTGHINCVEALVRWRHPDLGLIGPCEFLPAAEQGNVDSIINQWVIVEACRQLKEWNDAGLQGFRVSVNVSSRQFHHRGFESQIGEAIADAHVDPDALEIEIKEDVLARSSRTTEVLAGLKRLGTHVTIDDFGSGGIPFVSLRELNVDALKIAPMFVQNMIGRQDDAALVQAMITMARGLDLRIIAEGVESKDQLAYLLSKRCPDMQGFFFGKPLPASALTETLRMQH